MTKQILLVSSEFPPGPGGIGEHARGLAHELNRLGYLVSVVSELRHGYEVPSKFDNVTVQYLQQRGWKKAFSLARVLLTWMHKNREGWVIFSGLGPLMVSPMTRLFSRVRTLAVVHGHEALMSRSFNRSWLIFALRGFNVRVAVSEYSRSVSESLLRMPFVMIPNGFDPIKFGNGNPREKIGPLRLLTIGRISPRKGQHNVVAALPELLRRFPGTEYHIIGLPDHVDELRARASQLGVWEQVVVHGMLSNEDIRSRMAQADIFIMLSESQANGDVEGFGIAILEANFFGLPAIGSRGCGIEQAIAHRQSGWLVDPHDAFQVVEAVADIIAHHQEYRQRAQMWASQFTWMNIGPRYAEQLHV